MRNDASDDPLTDSPQFRALVVDDDARVRELTVRSLTQRDFQCDVAKDGMQALNQIETTDFDLVISDVIMPNKNGHALAVELLNRVCRPALIIMTGLMDAHLAEDLLDRGVEDIIFKPVEYNILAAKAQKVLRRTRSNSLCNGNDSDVQHRANIESEDAKVRDATDRFTRSYGLESRPSSSIDYIR